MCATCCRPSTSGLTGPPASYSVWAAGNARGNWVAQTDAPYCWLASHSHLCLSVPAAFLGDIALDEEDLRSFKVDRIIDLAQRSVQVLNNTDTGNNHRERRLQDTACGAKSSFVHISLLSDSKTTCIFSKCQSPAAPVKYQLCVFHWSSLNVTTPVMFILLHIATPAPLCSSVIARLCQRNYCS